MEGILRPSALRFDRASSLILLLLTLPLLFLPKVNLLSLQGETAGFRMDDLILFVFGVVLFWGHRTLRLTFAPPEKWMLAWTGLCLISFFINRLLYASGELPFPAKILYCFRLMEYFLFFYVGVIAARYFSVKQVLLAFLCWNVVLCLLQKGGILGSFTVEGYLASASERVSGITSFPNELALTLNILFCYLAFNRSLTVVQGFALFGVCALLIIWSGSRIALAALVFSLIGFLWHRPASRIWGLILAPTLVVALGVLMWNEEGLVGRSGSLMQINENFAVVSSVWESTDPEAMDWDAYGIEGQVDTSWWIRIHKWSHALALFVKHPELYLSGIGPGFATAALDGGLLRVLVETGFMGVMIFGGLLYSIARESLSMRWVIYVLLINMLFIDAHLSYKAMSLTFFLAGNDAFRLSKYFPPSFS